MGWRSLMYGLVAVGLLAAEDLPRGKVLDRVVCQGDERQSYALYIPSSYSADREWPIVYCLDPAARGRVPVERFAEAAEKAGYLVAGSNNSRNGPFDPVREAIAAMVNDTGARFSIDGDRAYAAGFSGGARMALLWAQNSRIAGVVACGAGFGGNKLPERIPFKIFAAAGVDDFNYHEMYAMSLELEKRGIQHRFMELEGGHDWLTPSAADEALEFFEGLVPPQAAKESKDEKKQAERYNRTSAQLEQADPEEQRALAERLRKEAARPLDSPERRLARQTLQGTYVAFAEAARSRMEDKNYLGAARCWEAAVVIRPENAGAWYQLAVAQSAAGNKGRALEALERAAATGFQDLERMEREPLLAPLRKGRRYEALVRGMGKSP